MDALLLLVVVVGLPLPSAGAAPGFPRPVRAARLSLLREVL